MPLPILAFPCPLCPHWAQSSQGSPRLGFDHVLWTAMRCSGETGRHSKEDKQRGERRTWGWRRF